MHVNSVMINESEYDQALDRDPELCEPFCTAPGWGRKVMKAHEHHSVANWSESETMSAMLSTPEGRQCMDAVADELMRRGTQLLAIADMVRQQMGSAPVAQ
mmetsp:Transcript_25221/g.39600  ORF Transcript_25221/g.39600 Transcript_25221/m.39600 type:complete len:101 (+) Transcript_25221:558-860(+)